MFLEPISGTKDPTAAARPGAAHPSGLDFAQAYEAAFDQIAASQVWLENGSEADPAFAFRLEPSPIGEPDSRSTCTLPQQAMEAAPSSGEQSSIGSAFDKNRLADWMDTHALARSSHRCAMYCREGMQAAGLTTSDRPASGDAADYGPFLLRHGAQVVAPAGYAPQVGDTVVFDRTDQHPSGHIEIYDGHQWVSDFLQHNFSPYRAAGNTPSFTIYRLA